MMPNELHLKEKHRNILEPMLRFYVPGVEVWAYGSRVNGRSHDGSDLDLVLRAPDLSEIPFMQMAGLRNALRESWIPFFVEVRDWSKLPERFHKEIETRHVVLIPSLTDKQGP
ncbi:MAG: nucleotidyltransferase domain-containing protein [Gammaproteobacteria bacterium]|nr:nucleotidyltransferase domain-containing protein [Gammaproteobacteria bacterium]